jgi:type II secretory pathway pseudopilin PulG
VNPCLCRAGGRLFIRLPPAGDCGASLVELLIVFALIAVMAAMAGPSTVNAMDAGRARQAAGFVAGRLRLAKQQAVMRTGSVGLVFDSVGGRWTFRVCVDGNGNGIRRSEIARGQDTCVEGPYDVASLYPGVTVAVDPTLRGPDGEAGSSDAVRFGASDLASFSASGSCTAGSLFLRSAKGEQYLVRVAGTNGRLRILRYDRGSRGWRDG